MAADVLGERVDDDIRPVLEGPAQVRGSDRVVHDQRDAVSVCNFSQPFQVDDVARRVADGLTEECTGFVIDEGFHCCRCRRKVGWY